MMLEQMPEEISEMVAAPRGFWQGAEAGQSPSGLTCLCNTASDPLKGMGPLLPICAPALSQAILSEVLERRPGRNGLSAVSSAEGQGLWTLAFASSWQTGHFASAIWKFLLAFALR